MRPLKALLLLFVFTTMVGCSSTQNVTSSSSSAPATARVYPDTLAEAPDDWQHLDFQQNNLRGISTERAYRTILRDKEPKQKVTVAIIDSGIDTDHEDLQRVIWTNEDEVPGNNEDDDDNGYVDDVHGWNFIGGPSGENVHHDTYELTRIYRRLSNRYEDVDPADLSAEEKEEYAYYQDIKQTFEQKVQQLEQQLAQTRAASQAVQKATDVLEAHLDTTEVTREQVAAIQTEQQDVQQAKALMMRLYQYGVTRRDLENQMEYFQNSLEYGYNPDFNPRPTVGDNYADKDERYYGNNDTEGPDPHHGTIVAGIVGANRQNQLGVKGIAGNVRIMPIRAVPDGDERDKDVANAIRYAVNNGADIINMSFGKGYSPYKEVVDQAVQYADKNGVLMIHAAGNDAANVDSTTNYPSKTYAANQGVASNWISVGALSWQGDEQMVAPFTNYGDEMVDVFAPGVDVYSTAPGNKYDEASGTSMAAPVVTGLAAMLMSYYPDLTASQVKTIILTSAVTQPNVQVTAPGNRSRTVAFGELSATNGIVNAYQAVKMAEKMQN